MVPGTDIWVETDRNGVLRGVCMTFLLSDPHHTVLDVPVFFDEPVDHQDADLGEFVMALSRKYLCDEVRLGGREAGGLMRQFSGRYDMEFRDEGLFIHSRMAGALPS